ncbi:MAG: YggS family pyridoxal phosphate-dependent enzyme [Gemmatimonadota bacterium]
MSDYPGFSERLAKVRSRIAEAAERSARDASAVTIVAVTKTHPSAAVEAVLQAGLRDVGENRVQELESKVEEVGRAAVRWHLIGHLQRNKAKKAIELSDLIHSVDSVRLARKLSDEAVAADRRVEAMIQVNPSGEESKSGLEEDAVRDQIAEICGLPGLRIVGLMTMAPFTDDERVQRTVFAATRRLAESASSVSGFEGRHLSMGMSNDFEIAVEEGSTMVRLGTVLLGERGE